ncbi:MAG TPA: insulinase family protein [Pyrinomonadaceae bacterium]
MALHLALSFLIACSSTLSQNSQQSKPVGAGPSRLYLNLREEKGYAYSISSFFNLPKYRGFWLASAAVRNSFACFASSLCELCVKN